MAYLLRATEVERIWRAWADADVQMAIVALLLQLGGIAVSTWRWSLLIPRSAADGVQVGYRRLFGLYLVGQFVNNFLPTAVSGDVVRGAQLGRRVGVVNAATSVFLERLSGFVVVGVMANVGILVASSTAVQNVRTDPRISLLVFVAAVAALVMLAVTVRSRSAAGALRPRTVIAVVALSVVFQATWVAVHVACGAALQIGAPLVVYVLLAAVTDIVGLVPVFVNNLGARELVFTQYLSQIGLPQSRSLALAFLVFTVRLVVSLLGGVLVLLGRGDFRLASRSVGARCAGASD